LVDVSSAGLVGGGRTRGNGLTAARIAGAAKDVLDRLESERERLRDDRAAVADYLLLYS
jgi:hypothetical protein